MLRLSRRYGDWLVLFNTPAHALFLSLMQNFNQSKFLQHLGFVAEIRRMPLLWGVLTEIGLQRQETPHKSP